MYQVINRLALMYSVVIFFILLQTKLPNYDITASKSRCSIEFKINRNFQISFGKIFQTNSIMRKYSSAALILMKDYTIGFHTQAL